MAENDSDNPMQAQLGLLGSSPSNQAFGFPTPPPPPRVPHPGDVSQSATMSSRAQAQNTLQTATSPQGFSSPGFGFGAQFGNAYGALQGQMFNPYTAQAMASMSGFGGFNTGMLPSPVQLTSPNMGIFRPFPQAPAQTFPPTPPLPLIPLPTTPTIPHPSFSTPMDFGYDQARYRGMQQAGAFVAAPGLVARGATDAIGALGVGAGLGALAGARLGGARGAVLGGTLGTLAGLVGSEALGFGAASERIVDRFNPFRSIYSQAHQLQTGTQGFIVGGSDLEVTGRGLSGNASRHLATQLRQASRALPSSGDNLTNTDWLKMTQLAGESGLLNMSQSTEQVVSQMKVVAKSMKTFMQLAGEPDMRAAMKSMGQLNSMGLTVPEMLQTASSARMFSRMAGTSVAGIMEYGKTGAELFQSNGLSAGLGLQVGMGSLGIAQQAVAGGAYSPRLLAMQGGVQGVAQREMMAQATTLQMPMMAMAAARMAGGGGFGFDQQAAHGLAGGMNLHLATTAGANNLLSAVGKGGVGALGMYQLQAPLLQDQLGRELGPLGLKNMQLQNVLQNMKMLGLSGQGGFATTATALYGKDIATDLVAQASSPEFFRGLQRQMDTQRSDLRGQTMRALEDRRPGFIERNTGIRAPWKYGAVQRMTDGVYETFENVGAAFDFTQENAAEANGQTLIRTPDALMAKTASAQRRVARLRESDIARVRRMAEQFTGSRRAVGYNARGEAYGGDLGDALGWRDGDLKDEYIAAHGSTLREHLRTQLSVGTEEMEKYMEGTTAAGRLFKQSAALTSDDRAALEKNLGVSSEKRGAFRDAVVTAARSMNRTMTINDLRTIGGQQLGLKSTDVDKLVQLDGSLIQAAGGRLAAQALTPREGSGLGDKRAGTNQLLSMRKSMLTAAYGSDGQHAEAAHELLMGTDNPDAAAFAALTLAGKSSEAEVFIKKLPAKRASLAREQGKQILELYNKDPSNEKLLPEIKKFADSVLSAGVDKAGSFATRIQKDVDATVGAKQLRAGMEKLGLSKELIDGDLGDTLNIIGSSKAATTTDERLRALGRRYTASKSVKERAALKQEATDYLRSQDGGSGAAMVGGTIDLEGETKLDRDQAAVAKTAGELNAMYKGSNPLVRSAASLETAAARLSEAAAKLGG